MGFSLFFRIAFSKECCFLEEAVPKVMSVGLIEIVEMTATLNVVVSTSSTTAFSATPSPNRGGFDKLNHRVFCYSLAPTVVVSINSTTVMQTYWTAAF